MKWPEEPFEMIYAVPSRNGIYKPKEFHGSGCRMVNMGELFGFDFISGQEMERVELTETELNVNGLEHGDLLFGRRSLVEAGAGKCSIVVEPPEPLTFESSIIRVRLDKRAVNPRFFFYYFLSPQGRGRIRSIVSGTSVKGIRGSDLRRLPVSRPPKDVQDDIADVLSAYDELMENNRRRMELLEESARLLYREWFVRLRFPGHEHARLTNGKPQGWERVPTPEAVEINPTTKLSDEEEHWYVEMADLPTDSMVIQSAIKRDGRSGSKFRNGDTLLARITPCLENGKTGFVNFMADGEAGRGSTEFIVLRSKRVTPEFVYCLARTHDFRGNAIKSMIGSSGRQRVQESCFEKFMVLIPPRSLLDLFSESAEPIFQQIKVLHAQNQKLRTARDLLLPRLMSGEIAV
jgi:type I restriction enzyme S subunit